MEIKLKEKYRVYNGDMDLGRRAQTQYSNGRSGGGNGKRPGKFLRLPAVKVESVHIAKAMFVDGKTGHRVMVNL